MTLFKGKSKTFKVTAISLAVAIALILILGSFFAYYAIKASTNNIYQGVRIGNVDVGGMTEDEAVKAVSKKYKAEDLNITVDCDGTFFDVYASAFSLKIDYDATVKEAVSYGKNGSVFSKIKNMRTLAKKPRTLGLVITCDYDALQYAINENLGAKLEDVQEYSVEIGENELIVTNGKSGRVVPAQKILDGISDAIVNNTLTEPIKVNIETKHPSSIDAETFYNEYNRDARDASVEKDGDEVTIIAEVVGIVLDKEQVKKIIEENTDNPGSYTIPAKITYPDITAADLEAEYTDTVIGTYSTNYSTSSQNRKTNIHLASEKINGLVLNPGEVFSFNDIVGPRTEANGYKIAHVYSGAKVVDGLGGGICQVSSTLYNAVVFADLEIVYRKNHSLPVSYTPLGRDATVSYGTIDFKFKNNKETPVKFEVVHDGTTLTVNVYGRKKYIKDISIETAITGSVPFSVTEIEDDTMYVGETKTEESGVNGTNVESYKIIKENGEVVSRSLLAKSSYSPQSKVVRVGTKPKEEDVLVPEDPEIIPDEPQPPSDPQEVPEISEPTVNTPEPVIPDETTTASSGETY